MNTELMFSSKTELWETPIEFYNELDKKYKFNLDVCALPENTKCKNYFTPSDNSLIQDWNGVCWMNPPYGREATALWINKAINEVEKGNAEVVICLVPARVDTRWFHNLIYHKYNFWFVKGRLKFGGSKDSAPFPSMVIEIKKGGCL